MTITKPQAQMLAALACDARPVGARQWNPDDVMAEIAKVVGRNLGAVICAVTRAAMDRGAERPSVIASNGSHWSDTTVEVPFTPTAAPPGTRCTVCGQVEGFHTAGKQVDHPHSPPREKLAPDVIHGAIAALKDAIEPTAEAKPVRTLDELAADNPKLHANVDALRVQLPAPPMRETESTKADGEEPA